MFIVQPDNPIGLGESFPLMRLNIGQSRKKNPSTYHTCFGFTLKTGMAYSPKRGFYFYGEVTYAVECRWSS